MYLTVQEVSELDEISKSLNLSRSNFAGALCRLGLEDFKAQINDQGNDTPSAFFA
ncbi:hypothetical protein [Chromobacterium sinusclupearum]|uniref:hypothetical protein n=1 Tax=Chromobacterium sinusclupearum TaxID=2077146 RepID=UPI001304C549|nr:hypothetical protein [Chromobacterium sinusclupearum]